MLYQCRKNLSFFISMQVVWQKYFLKIWKIETSLILSDFFISVLLPAIEKVSWADIFPAEHISEEGRGIDILSHSFFQSFALNIDWCFLCFNQKALHKTSAVFPHMYSLFRWGHQEVLSRLHQKKDKQWDHQTPSKFLIAIHAPDMLLGSGNLIVDKTDTVPTFKELTV